MFLTWQLWKALRFPMRQHPIFNYARRHQESSDARSRVLPLIALALMIIFAIVFPLPAIITTLGVVLGLPLFLILFNGTVLGAIWVTGVSTMIGSSRQDKHFDLMQISLQGAIGVSWLLCTGVIHRHNWLRDVYRTVKWVVMLVLVLLALAIAMLILGAFTSESEALQEQQIRVVREVINICLIVCALWLDHIQSIVVATVLGILLPSIIKEEVQLRSLAPIIYLLLQMCTYLTIIAIYRFIDLLIMGLFANTWFASFVIIALSLVSFYIMREVIIHALWRLILIKYDASLDEYRNAIQA